MKRRFLLPVVGLVVLLAATQALAGPIGFATAWDRSSAPVDLYSIDLTAGSATRVGSTGVFPFIEGLAFSPGGQLYGTTTGGDLYSINPVTGLATLVGSTGLGDIEALHFDGSTLLAVDFKDTPTIYSLDTANASATSVVTASMETGHVRAGTLVGDDYFLVRGDGSGSCTGDCLYLISLATGGTLALGPLSGTGADGSIAGFDFTSSGLLYGVNPDGRLLNINPLLDTATAFGPPTGLVFLDFAVAPQSEPVPDEPASILLLGTGLAGVVARAWRKRRR